MFGAAPGVGKSTVCASLAASLVSDGLRVEHFREEDLFNRTPFAEFAAEFSADGTIDMTKLVDATVAYLDDVDADVVVMDALIPYMPTLLALGYDEPAIDAVIDGLTARIANTTIEFVFLDGDPEAALTRAIAREDDGWIDWYVAKLVRYGLVPPDAGLDGACVYLRRERDEMLRTVERQDWSLCLVEDATSKTPESILDEVLTWRSARRPVR